LGTFSRSERKANTSSMGLAIITVFSKVATSRSSVRTPTGYPPCGSLPRPSNLCFRELCGRSPDVQRLAGSVV
jgi:hypothetical protein